jgi:hypothetical protein
MKDVESNEMAEPPAESIISAYDFHELALLFPLMEGEPFDELVADIKENGLRDPIVLLDGKILDGRNRFRACEAAGVQPRFKTYEGGDPLGFIVSANLHRRHLNASQRAMIAARLASMRQGERTDLEPCSNSSKVSQPKAARLLNVSRSSLQAAKVVQEHGSPELQQAVTAGEVSVSRAAAMARPEERTELSRELSDAIRRERTAAAKDKIDYAKRLERDPETNELSLPLKSAPDFLPGRERERENERKELQPYIDATVELFGVIDLTIEDDQIAPLVWAGRAWIAPFDARPCWERITAKLIDELDASHIEEAVMLLSNETNLSRFQTVAIRANAICFPSGVRSRALLYYGPAAQKFASLFSGFGFVVQPLREAAHTAARAKLAAAPALAETAPASAKHAELAERIDRGEIGLTAAERELEGRAA